MTTINRIRTTYGLQKRLVVGAASIPGLLTKGPALLDAEVDILVWIPQTGLPVPEETIQTIKKKYPDVKIGGGNSG